MKCAHMMFCCCEFFCFLIILLNFHVHAKSKHYNIDHWWVKLDIDQIDSNGNFYLEVPSISARHFRLLSMINFLFLLYLSLSLSLSLWRTTFYRRRNWSSLDLSRFENWSVGQTTDARIAETCSSLLICFVIPLLN